MFYLTKEYDRFHYPNTHVQNTTNTWGPKVADHTKSANVHTRNGYELTRGETKHPRRRLTEDAIRVYGAIGKQCRTHDPSVLRGVDRVFERRVQTLVGKRVL